MMSGHIFGRVADGLDRRRNHIRRARHAGVDHSDVALEFPQTNVADLRRKQVDAIDEFLRLDWSLHLPRMMLERCYLPFGVARKTGISRDVRV